MDCSLPCSSIHGIFQARVLKWVAILNIKYKYSKKEWVQRLLVQDGGIEGCVLISSFQRPKLQLAIEQPSRRGCGNPPNKDTPSRKTKKELQWVGRRGAITIISNPRNARWVTHRWENNNTKEVLALLWRFWTPCQVSQPGDPTKRLGIWESGP